MFQDDNKRVAVFIDAENISADYAERILDEASSYGDVFVKRIFADWSNNQMQSWKNKVQQLSLKPVQQFPAVKGKNASDIALAVDVMTALHEKEIDVFCLISSDSDFISLVQELREREKLVIGFGMKQTIPAFVNSFSEFIYLDKNQRSEIEKGKIKTALPKDKLDALREIVESLIERRGKALYGSIGIEMKNKFADFIPKNYGSKTMKDFIEKNLQSVGNYKIELEKDGTTLYLVPKE